MTCKPPIIAIIGPTGIGKTQLSIVLARAFSGEVISVDSIQVYRENPILAGTVTPQEAQGIPHHLLSYLDADQEPHDFLHDTFLCIKGIQRRGRIPILCGGSISLTEPLLSHRFMDQHQLHVICLNSPLSVLGRFTDTRIDKMVCEGLMDEVHTLHDPEPMDSVSAPPEKGIWKTIGYPEFRACCEVADAIERQSLFEQGVANMKAHTREYARLQLEQIWFTLLPGLFQRQRSLLVLNVEAKETFMEDVELPAIRQCKRWVGERRRITRGYSSPGIAKSPMESMTRRLSGRVN